MNTARQTNIIPIREQTTMTKQSDTNKSAWAWSVSVGSSSVKSVLTAMAECANPKTLLAYPSIPHICQMTELNRKTVIAALQALVDMTLIEDTGDRAGYTRQVTIYRLMVGNSPVFTMKQYQKRDSSENGTVPKTDGNSPVFTMKQSQKRTETVPKTGHVTLSNPKLTLINPNTPLPPQTDSEPKTANAANAAGVSVQQVVDLYHEVLPSLPSVLKVTDARRKAIAARIRDDLKTVAQWESYFGKVAPSDFLMGRVDGFRADLEWLCKPANMLKVLEGRYERNQAKPAPPQSKHNGFAQRDYSVGINPDGSF